MATDRRTKYTKSVIRQALFDLLKEKPLNKITVTDICKMADINRSTFYSYYEDVYALLTQIQNELFENIVLTLANDNWFNDILHLIDQNRDLCQVLIGPHGILPLSDSLCISDTITVCASGKKIYPNADATMLDYSYAISGKWSHRHPGKLGVQ